MSEMVGGVVMGAVPTAQLLSSSAGELAYRLPMSAMSSFPSLLEQLEDNKSTLGIGSYGMSMTTLEEVFLRLAELAEGLNQEQEENEMASERHGSERRLSLTNVIGSPGALVPFGGGGGGGGGGGIGGIGGGAVGSKALPGSGSVTGGSQSAAATPTPIPIPTPLAPSPELNDGGLGFRREGGGVMEGGTAMGGGLSLHDAESDPAAAAAAAAPAPTTPPDASAFTAAAAPAAAPAKNGSVGVGVGEEDHDDESAPLVLSQPEGGEGGGQGISKERGRGGGGGVGGGKQQQQQQGVGGGGEWGEEGPAADFWKQLKRLYIKRATIASRDLSGLFYQVVFPVLEVACVLLLLSIELNFTGPPISLDGNMFGLSNQLVHTKAATYEVDYMSESVLPEALCDTEDSYDLSSYLLETYDSENRTAEYRFGAVAAEDTLEFILHVNPDYTLSIAQRLLNGIEFGNLTLGQDPTTDGVVGGWENVVGWLEDQGVEVNGTRISLDVDDVLNLVEAVEELDLPFLSPLFSNTTTELLDTIRDFSEGVLDSGVDFGDLSNVTSTLLELFDGATLDQTTVEDLTDLITSFNFSTALLEDNPDVVQDLGTALEALVNTTLANSLVDGAGNLNISAVESVLEQVEQDLLDAMEGVNTTSATNSLSGLFDDATEGLGVSVPGGLNSVVSDLLDVVFNNTLPDTDIEDSNGDSISPPTTSDLNEFLDGLGLGGVENLEDVEGELERLGVDEDLQRRWEEVLRNATDGVSDGQQEIQELLGGVYEDTVNGVLDATEIPASFTIQLPGGLGELQINTEVVGNGTALPSRATLGDSIQFEGGEFEIDLEAFYNSVFPTPDQDLTAYLYLTPDGPTVLHNSTAFHGVAAYATEVTKSTYRAALDRPDATYVVRNHPLPLTARQSLDVKTILSLFVSLFLLIPFCYVPATFGVFVVQERAVKSKHLQFVSGVEPLAYWLSTYAWDMTQYTTLALGSMAVAGIYKLEPWTDTGEQVAAAWLVLWLYGAAAVPLSYVYSFMFDNSNGAQITIMGINFITGFVMVMAYFIMSAIESTQDIAAQLVHLFRLFPPYNFGEGILAISYNFYGLQLVGIGEPPFAWEAAGRPLVYLSLQAVGFFVLTMILEAELVTRAIHRLKHSSVLKAPPPPPIGGGGELVTEGGYEEGAYGDVAVEPHRPVADAISGMIRWVVRLFHRAGAVTVPMEEGVEEDEDVALERRRVRDAAPDEECHMVRLEGLRKVYPPRGQSGPKVAVRDLSLAIPRGEIFGFLGINGAGKTTTMSMLTGDVLPSAGSMHIAGLDVVAQQARVRRKLGYCPQFDPLLGKMTGRETLRMFAVLKGIRAASVERVVEGLLLEVGLGAYMDRECGSYSGGNKRKLSLALALIGRPAVVFLDEPSTGMDPVARRHMWDVIARYGRERSIILTTHSMEECEALCGRICIMVGGRMQCLGSAQHLKSRFSGGYLMEVKVCSEADVGPVRDFVEGAFEGGKLEEFYGTRLKYRLPEQQLRLSAIFRTVEDNRERLNIEYYSLSQATLEQIFIAIAKNQQEETTEIAGVVY